MKAIDPLGIMEPKRQRDEGLLILHARMDVFMQSSFCWPFLRTVATHCSEAATRIWRKWVVQRERARAMRTCSDDITA
jgi:hypothetical protein